MQDVWSDFETPEAAKKVVKLKAFSKFENTTEALQAAASLVDSKLSKGERRQQQQASFRPTERRGLGRAMGSEESTVFTGAQFSSKSCQPTALRR